MKKNLMLYEVQRKAKTLLNMLKERGGEGYTQEFIANNGQFRRFQAIPNLLSGSER